MNDLYALALMLAVAGCVVLLFVTARGRLRTITFADLVEQLVLFAISCVLFTFMLLPQTSGVTDVICAFGISLAVAFGGERILRIRERRQK